MNKIKEELNKQKDSPCSWTRKLNIVKMSVLPDMIQRFNEFLIKILASYFVDINKLILKFTWKGKGPRTANTILKEKNKVGEVTQPDIKTYP